MKKFDIILDALQKVNNIDVDEWQDETEELYGLIGFYCRDTGKSYQMFWNNDTITEFEEVT